MMNNLNLKKKNRRMKEKMSFRGLKFCTTAMYGYGFVRSLYYNGKLKDRDDGKELLFGDKFKNICFGTFLSFPFFPIYIYDDLNVIDSRMKNIKYLKDIFPFIAKID